MYFRFGRYGRINVMYTKAIDMCMKFITDKDGNISMERMVNNSKKFVALSWTGIVLSVLLMCLGVLCIFGAVFIESAFVAGLILFVLLFFFGTILLSIAIVMLQVGYTFSVASKCLKDKIEVVKCPFCGNNLDYEDKFCGKCGAKFKVEATCTNCGTKNMYDARFCKRCGKSLISNVNSQNTKNQSLDSKILGGEKLNIYSENSTGTPQTYEKLEVFKDEKMKVNDDEDIQIFVVNNEEEGNE